MKLTLNPRTINHKTTGKPTFKPQHESIATMKYALTLTRTRKLKQVPTNYSQIKQAYNSPLKRK